jgi:hypothetical protein
MTNTTPSIGYGKVGASVVAAWLGSYTMTQLSLHGVNFEELGVSSEIVKSTIIGTLVGFITWASPSNFVHVLIDIIIFCKDSIRQIRSAINNPNN